MKDYQAPNGQEPYPQRVESNNTTHATDAPLPAFRIWWDGLTYFERYTLLGKYHDEQGGVLVSDNHLEKIYNSEHPKENVLPSYMEWWNKLPDFEYSGNNHKVAHASRYRHLIGGKQWQLLNESEIEILYLVEHEYNNPKYTASLFGTAFLAWWDMMPKAEKSKITDKYHPNLSNVHGYKKNYLSLNEWAIGEMYFSEYPSALEPDSAPAVKSVICNSCETYYSSEPNECMVCHNKTFRKAEHPAPVAVDENEVNDINGEPDKIRAILKQNDALVSALKEWLKVINRSEAAKHHYGEITEKTEQLLNNINQK